MKRLKLKERPKKLRLLSNTVSTQKTPTQESTQPQGSPDIEQILEEYHKQTEEDNRLPWQKWIPFSDHLPLDNDDYIIVWSSKAKSFYDTRSFVALQHYLHAKYCGYPIETTYWMRISIP